MNTNHFFHRRWHIAAAAAAMMLSASVALAQPAAIDNGSDPSILLSLRQQPDKSAQTVGKFLSGTQVDVLRDAGNGWSEIAIGAVRGYAMTQYLSDSARVNATLSRCVTSPYGTQSVVLRDRPSNSYNAVAMLMVGDSVMIIGEMNDFRFVKTGSGFVGCLLESELK